MWRPTCDCEKLLRKSLYRNKVIIRLLLLFIEINIISRFFFFFNGLLDSWPGAIQAWTCSICSCVVSQIKEKRSRKEGYNDLSVRGVPLSRSLQLLYLLCFSVSGTLGKFQVLLWRKMWGTNCEERWCCFTFCPPPQKKSINNLAKSGWTIYPPYT